MSAFPKDGSTFVVECVDRTAYRWAKYKPQGAKQMGKPGRWQKMAINGDWHRWENCEEPVGEISPLTEDGPITKAFKSASSKDAVERLRDIVGWLSEDEDNASLLIASLTPEQFAAAKAAFG